MSRRLCLVSPVISLIGALSELFPARVFWLSLH
jgi:hypothetical protein